MSTKKLKGQLTKEKISELKAKYGKLIGIKVDDRICYLKTPDRKVMSFAMSFAQTDPLKFAETILNNCFVAGDEEIKTDDVLFLSVTAQLNNLIEIKESKLVKL